MSLAITNIRGFMFINTIPIIKDHKSQEKSVTWYLFSWMLDVNPQENPCPNVKFRFVDFFGEGNFFFNTGYLLV